MFWSSVPKCLLAVCVVMEFAGSFVESFTCENFTSMNEPIQFKDKCETTQSCFSQIQEFKVPEPSTSLVAQQKGCSTGGCTELTFSATLGDQRTFRYSHRCCKTDNCNAQDTQPSQVSAEANGLQCLANYADTGTLSLPTLLKCTGNETMCISFIGTAESSNPFLAMVVGTGCATESACNLNMIIFDNIKIRTFCSRGYPVLPESVPDSTGLRPTPISTVPVLSVLLLLKVLL